MNKPSRKSHAILGSSTLTGVLLLTGLLAAFLTGSASPAVTYAMPKVLVVTGGHGFEKGPFLKMFEENPPITFVHAAHGTTNAAAYQRADLLNYDVVVLYDMPKGITETQKTKFLSLFDRGIGLVVLHHALVSFQHWPDYERIVGGRYPEADGTSGVITAQVGYEHDVDVPVTVVGTNHPITADLQDFTIHDEIYWGFRVGSDVTPLLSTTHPKSGKPLAWARTERKSRVVFIQLGHDHRAYENPNFRKLLANSIRWAARRDQ
ncbi:MAG TPA: ThuA domain-containing protein [Verrucomicrobiae bacterium]